MAINAVPSQAPRLPARRVEPRRMAWAAWIVLFVFTMADTLTAHLMISQAGTRIEANPLVVTVWQTAGLPGLVLFKTAAILFLGLVLILQSSRLTISVAAGAVGLTMWAVAANLQAYTGLVTPATVFLFGPISTILAAIGFFYLFYRVIYGRVVERRTRPRFEKTDPPSSLSD